MSDRKTHWLILLGLLSLAGSVQAAEMSAPSITVAQGGTADIIVSAQISATEATGGYTIVLELLPQAGATGSLTFTPAANAGEEDIVELNDPFGGGIFSSLDTNDVLSLIRNGATKSNTLGGLPESIVFNGTLARFPIVAGATATGSWDIRLQISSPSSASAWNPSGTISTTLIEGAVTVTIPFCNNPSQCDDGNPCTDNDCVAGNCVFTNNTIPCDDSDNCTIGDLCSGGFCVGTAPDCSAAGDQCNVASCNPAGAVGNCDTMTPVGDATPCDDNNACTTGDQCTLGVCVAGTPTVCTPLDQCHVAGTCDTVTGVCDNPLAADGVSCDDSDLCTFSDVCVAGACAGTSVDCTMLDDDCNIGVCDNTGTCVPQPFADGTACDDTDVCTNNDQCLAGACVGTPITSCVPCVVDADCAASNPNPTCRSTVCSSNVCQFPSNGTCPTVSLHSDAFCYDESGINTVTVMVDISGMGGLTNPLIAGQVYLEYDTSRLSFVSMIPGGTGDPTNPFDVQLLLMHDAAAGTIDYAVAVAPGGTGTTADMTIAMITFTTIGQCDPFVRFRTHTPPTNVVDSTGQTVAGLITEDMDQIRIDGTPPAFSSCQASLGDMVVHADAGETTAVVTWLTPIATDNCDGSRAVTCTRTASLCNGGDRNGLPCTSDAACPGTPAGTCEAIGPVLPTGLSGDTLPEGRHTITCTASDACDGTAVAGLGTCAFDVSVYGESALFVDVDLGGVDGNPIRCVTFDLWNCDDSGQPVETVKKEIGFTAGTAVGVEVLVPSGVYTCITARDELHTLRSTGTMTDVGVSYSASFATASGGNPLRGGNINDDAFIDIIDFALMNFQFNTLASPNTDCTLSPPTVHAELTGNGIIDSADFSVLSFNFAQGHEANCCGAPAPLFGGDGPLMEISVQSLYAMGLGHLEGADLTGDGWVDLADVEAFMNGESVASPKDQVGRSPRGTNQP